VDASNSEEGFLEAGMVRGVMRATVFAGAAFGLLAVGSLKANASNEDDQEPSTEMASIPANALTVQAGFLPGASLVGLQYARILHRHIDIAAAISYGMTADASLVPRLRIEAGHVSISIGAGPSVAYEKGGVGERGRWYVQAVADLELTYRTVDRWLLQTRLGLTVARVQEPSMDTDVLPYLGIGVGRAL
jgi:hypothetical protein